MKSLYIILFRHQTLLDYKYLRTHYLDARIAIYELIILRSYFFGILVIPKKEKRYIPIHDQDIFIRYWNGLISSGIVVPRL